MSDMLQLYIFLKKVTFLNNPLYLSQEENGKETASTLTKQQNWYLLQSCRLCTPAILFSGF